jgi:gliding motility-associated-like protein
MKKITLVIFMSLLSFLGYAQFPESFDTGIPATWNVSDNGLGAPQNWTTTSTLFLPTHGGAQHAIANRGAIGAGNTSENWLVTPQITLPANGQLRFWTKMTISGDSGTLYQLRVSTTSQTNHASFTTIQQWTEAELETAMAAGGSSAYNVYGEIVKNLTPAYTAGQTLWIAFVKVNEQTGAAAEGDRWLIDDVNLVQQCVDPLTLNATLITSTSAQLSWTSPGPATSWDIEMVPSPGAPLGVPTRTGVTNPYNYTGLTPGTQYSFYVRSVCGVGNTSNWVGPFIFITTPLGQVCSGPIPITTLPYTHTSNTNLYGDDYNGSAGASCGTAGNYLNGDDVVYSFTPTFTGLVDISMTPTANASGLFVYSSCANIGVSCMAGVSNTAGGIRNIPNFAVTAGTTYYIVISTNGTPQSTGYTLVLQQVNCAQPTALTATGITATGVTLGWTSAFSAFEYVIQPAGTGLPMGAGTPSANPVTVNTLTSNTQYEYYVRTDCGGGLYSIWAGPFAFRTLCGPIAVPFFEGFNGTPASPTEICWTVLNVNADANAWNMNYATTPFEGDQAASIVSSTSTNNDWLISPQLVLNGNQRLRYRYRVASAASACNFEVKVSTGGPVEANFTTTIVPQASYTNVTYLEKFVNLTGITGNVNIGWHVAPGANGSRIFIDAVIVEDIPPCPQPIDLTVTGITPTTATINWTPGSTETSWQVVVQATGLPAPTLATQGTTVNTPPPYVATGLLGSTTYDVYVLANCGANGPSVWTGPITFTTLIAPPVCGGTFFDTGGSTAAYANNENSTWTIFPVNPGDVVTVTFTSFNVQATSDGLYVYNGNSTAAPQFSSTNGAGTPLNLPGAYWGTTVPGPFTSSAADGSLTFNFVSNGSTTAAGWAANVTCGPRPTCAAPLSISQSALTYNSVNLAWTGGTATAWEVIAVPCGSPRPTAASAGWVPASTNPFTLTGLTGSTCYDFYVRGICSPTDASAVVGPVSATTPVTPPICGGNFYDSGGPSASYAASENRTVTICPTNPTDLVTVTFTAFALENNFDFLRVYDGNSAAAPLLATLTGTTLPPSFTSSATTGCLTFVFTSDSSVNSAGWAANVTCAPPPTCPRPTGLTATTVTNVSATLGWTNVGPATAWQVIALPCGSPIPTAATPGWVPAPTNPFVLTGLNQATCYDFYVMGVCSPTDSSTPSNAYTATTQVTPPACGGNFYDTGGPSASYAANANSTVTICPANPGDVVTVTFSAFATENNFDFLRVYDGNSAAAPLLATLTGTAIPPAFTSSSINGCLTFVFTSDGSVQSAGWAASVTCSPAPTCPRKPITLTATQVTSTSALLGWTETGTATQWQVLVLPAGSPVPVPGTTGTIVNSNPALITGLNPSTTYTFFVSALCTPTDASYWSNGFNFTTAPANDECATATFAPVNANAFCNQTVPGTLSLATGSVGTPIAPCIGTADDDVWYQFIATNSYLNVSLQNVLGSTTNLNFAVYSGSCAGLTQVFCSAAGALQGTLNGLTVGQTYYIRVYSNAATPQTTTFNLCISTPSTCATASTVCSVTYGNTTGVTSLGTIGCLGSSPNPTYFTIQVGTSGPISFELTQSSPGSATPNLDVDYAAWGPFTSQAAGCAAGIPFITPVNTNPSGDPQDHGCSFNAASIEQFNIPNALAGQFYIILITNYSNQSGSISLTQTNAGQPGAGTTICCPDANFSYVPGTYCKGTSANPVATIATGSLAGTFSSPNPAVVFVNTATGEINLAATPAGNYIIYNTLAATATCGVKTYSYVITIVEPALATIAYGASSYCNNLAGTQPVTVTGTPGGTFAVTPVGLLINANTGAITPVGSVPGTYTVSYNFPVTTGCGTTSFATTVTINATPNPAPTVVQPTCTTPTGTITVLPTAATYEYSIDGGLSYLANNVFGGLTPNTYSVVIRDTTTGCISAPFPVTVNAVPVAPVAPTTTLVQPTCITGGQITVTSPLNGAVAYNNLFISEVTDANTGSLTYVEIYNGTGASVNMAGYKLKFYNSLPATTTSCNFPLSGTLANNAVYVVKVSADANQPGIVPNLSVTTCGGVNNDDNIRLTTSADVEIDNWGRRDGNPYTPNNQTGYTYRRLATAVAPSNTWNAADWTAIDPEVYTNVGSFTPATSNYQFSIDGVTYQASNVFTNVPAGTYNVTVMDIVTGCISNATVVVLNTPVVPVAPTVTATSPTTCAVPTGSLTVTAPVGASYEYSIDGVTYQSAATFAGLVPATYNVIVRDITTGCVSTATSATILPAPGSPAAPTASVTVQPTCIVTTGTIVITAPLGATLEYSIDGGVTYQSGTTFAGLLPGTYNVSVHDTASGCISTATTLTVNPIPANPAAPTASATVQPTCIIPTGTIEVTAPIGASYEYSIDGVTYQAGVTFAGLTPGNYNVTVRDVTTGCISSVTVVTVDPIPANPVAPTASVTVQPTCAVPTGTIEVTAPIGVTLEYSVDGVTYQTGLIFAGLTPATYNVTVRDVVTGCVSSATPVTITPVAGAPVAPTASTTVQPTCAIPTGTIVVTAPLSANYEYSVNGTTYQAGTTFTGLVSGTYSVTVRDTTTGCVSPITTVVVDPIPASPLVPSVTVTVQPTCTNPTASIEITSPLGATYEYNVDASVFQASPIFTGLTAGMHTVTVRDNVTGCTSQASIEIIAPVSPDTPGLVVNTQPACNDLAGSIEVLSPIGANYQYAINAGIYQNNPIFAGLNEGIYTITVMDIVTGCVSQIASIDVQDLGCTIPRGISPNGDGKNDAFDISTLNVTKLSIFNRYGVATYTYGSGYTNQWHGQSNSGQELPDGTYYYVIDTAEGQTRTGWVYINRER